MERVDRRIVAYLLVIRWVPVGRNDIHAAVFWSGFRKGKPKREGVRASIWLNDSMFSIAVWWPAAFALGGLQQPGPKVWEYDPGFFKDF